MRRERGLHSREKLGLLPRRFFVNAENIMTVRSDPAYEFVRPPEKQGVRVSNDDFLSGSQEGVVGKFQRVYDGAAESSCLRERRKQLLGDLVGITTPDHPSARDMLFDGRNIRCRQRSIVV